MTDDEREQLRAKVEQKSADLSTAAQRIIERDEEIEHLRGLRAVDASVIRYYEQADTKCAIEIERLTKENLELRAGGAKVTHALDCALQLTEVLIAFLPEGQPVHPGLETAKGALAQALKELRQ
jgi:16S rRNA U1498 N3-methylase RsmE